MKYRPEIDGLRALSVVSIIFYHAGFSSFFGGGYVGVDVFFVISGYLITSIILADITSSSFSLLNFYERRARRIFPALFLVMFSCLIFAYFNFLPSDLKFFSQNLAAAVLFLSNFYSYFFNNYYFGVNSSYNPLIHFWSLALEEQFYLLFPMILISWLYLWKKLPIALLVVFSFISISIAQFFLIKNPLFSFYLLPCRAWEFLVGSFIAFYFNGRVAKKNHNVEQFFSCVGLFLIAYSVLTYNDKTLFPGAYALQPTFGAALIIIFAKQNTYVGKILSLKFISSVGLVSYSAYLWHQPLFAFIRYLSPNKISDILNGCLVLLTFFFAYFTWKYIETPFRNKNFLTRRQFLIFSLSACAFFITFGVIGYYNGGYPDRDPLFKRLEFNTGLSKLCNGNFSLNSNCISSPYPTYAIFGDSYAMHLVDGFKYTYPEVPFLQLTQDSCSPYISSQIKKFGKLDCNKFYNFSMQTLKDNLKITNVIISSSFFNLLVDDNINSLKKTIYSLKRINKRVIIVGPTPSNGNNFGKCFVLNRNFFDKCNFLRSSINHSFFENVRILKKIASETNVEFFDLTDVICGEFICHASLNNYLIYRDDGHLSREGSKYVIQNFSIVRN